jgi:hypothetical protein
MSLRHEFASVSVETVPERASSVALAHHEVRGSAYGQAPVPVPAPAPRVTPPAPGPPPVPAAAPKPAPATPPSLSLENDSYTDSGKTSHKNIKFKVKVPSSLTATDYALVNKLQGSSKKADGTPHKVTMYGSTVDYDFPKEQVDSLDADPVYWSDASARWNYTTESDGFSATDDPGPPGYKFEPGDVTAVKFKIGLYKLSDLPTTTSGSIAATPVEEKPWQYSVTADAKTGALSHPAL